MTYKVKKILLFAYLFLEIFLSELLIVIFMEEEKPAKPEPFEEPVQQPYQPPQPVDPQYQDPYAPPPLSDEERRRKRRRRILIILAIVFGSLIVLGLIGIGIIYAIGLTLATACENMCSACGTSCGESCSESCSNACTCDNCGGSSGGGGAGDMTSVDIETFAKYVWEYIRNWFNNFFP